MSRIILGLGLLATVNTWAAGPGSVVRSALCHSRGTNLWTLPWTLWPPKSLVGKLSSCLHLPLKASHGLCKLIFRWANAWPLSAFWFLTRGFLNPQVWSYNKQQSYSAVGLSCSSAGPGSQLTLEQDRFSCVGPHIHGFSPINTVNVFPLS